MLPLKIKTISTTTTKKWHTKRRNLHVLHLKLGSIQLKYQFRVLNQRQLKKKKTLSNKKTNNQTNKLEKKTLCNWNEKVLMRKLYKLFIVRI